MTRKNSDNLKNSPLASAGRIEPLAFPDFTRAEIHELLGIPGYSESMDRKKALSTLIDRTRSAAERAEKLGHVKAAAKHWAKVGRLLNEIDGC